MVRVYFLCDGLGYGERFLLAYLSAQMSRDRAFFYDGVGKFAEDIGVSKTVLSSLMKSLESKSLIEVNRQHNGYRRFIFSAKLKLKGGRWIRVPKSFLYAGSPKERGLLLTIAANHKPVGMGDLRVKKTPLYLKEWTTEDVKDTKTLRKMIRSLQQKGFVLIEKTRPYYLLRVVM